jgi:hypothetical protein
LYGRRTIERWGNCMRKAGDRIRLTVSYGGRQHNAQKADRPQAAGDGDGPSLRHA